MASRPGSTPPPALSTTLSVEVPGEEHVLVSDQLAVSTIELENIRRIFDKFDDNNSDTIDVSELQLCLRAVGHYLTMTQVEELMEEVTESPSKRELSFEEFVNLILFWKDTARYRLFEMAGSIHQQHIEIASRIPFFVTDIRWRWFWDMFLLFVVVYLVCSTPLYYVSRIRESVRTPLVAFDSLISVVLAVDVFVWMRTAITDRYGQLHSDTVSTLKDYLGWNMAIDVLSAVPWTVLPPHVGVGFVWLRFLKALRMKDLWKQSRFVPIDSAYVNFHYTLLPILTGLCYFVMFVHCVAAIALMLDEELRYVTAVYYAMYCISGVGYGDVPVTVDTHGKQWYTGIVMLTSMVVNGYVVGNLVSYFQTSDVTTEKKTKLRETSAVCSYFEIPDSLSNEITQFQDYILRHKLSVMYNELLKDLPMEMRTQFNVYARVRLLQCHPMFGGSHQGVQVAIAQSIDPCVYCPEEFVIIADEEAEDSYFIAYGFVDIASRNGFYLCTLKQLDYFGDAALFVPGLRRLVSAKALTYCDLFVLNREVFQGILQRYPLFRRSIKQLEEAHQERARSGIFTEDDTEVSSPENIRTHALNDTFTPAILRGFEVMRTQPTEAGGGEEQGHGELGETQADNLTLRGDLIFPTELLPQSLPTNVISLTVDAESDMKEDSDSSVGPSAERMTTRRALLMKKRKTAREYEANPDEFPGFLGTGPRLSVVGVSPSASRRQSRFCGPTVSHRPSAVDALMNRRSFGDPRMSLWSIPGDLPEFVSTGMGKGSFRKSRRLTKTVSGDVCGAPQRVGSRDSFAESGPLPPRTLTFGESGDGSNQFQATRSTSPSSGESLRVINPPSSFTAQQLSNSTPQAVLQNMFFRPSQEQQEGGTNSGAQSTAADTPSSRRELHRQPSYMIEVMQMVEQVEQDMEEVAVLLGQLEHRGTTEL